jgi:hypothetical protein
VLALPGWNRCAAADFPVSRHGFVSVTPADTWEQGLLSGNGTIGANVLSRPLDETIIFTHARMFLPTGNPVPPPDTHEDPRRDPAIILIHKTLHQLMDRFSIEYQNYCFNSTRLKTAPKGGQRPRKKSVCGMKQPQSAGSRFLHALNLRPNHND